MRPFLLLFCFNFSPPNACSMAESNNTCGQTVTCDSSKETRFSAANRPSKNLIFKLRLLYTFVRCFLVFCNWNWNGKITKKNIKTKYWCADRKKTLSYVSLVFWKSTEYEHWGRRLKIEKSIADVIGIADILGWKISISYRRKNWYRPITSRNCQTSPRPVERGWQFSRAPRRLGAPAVVQKYSK